MRDNITDERTSFKRSLNHGLEPSIFPNSMETGYFSKLKIDLKENVRV